MDYNKPSYRSLEILRTHSQMLYIYHQEQFCSPQPSTLRAKKLRLLLIVQILTTIKYDSKHWHVKFIIASIYFQHHHGDGINLETL